MAVGIPENDVLPTLSYSDFYELSSSGQVNWRSINTYIYDKYKKRSAAGDLVAAGFVKSLSDNRANLLMKKSVLVVPGFWKTFSSIHEALKLARSILAASKFRPLVMVRGHHASTAANACELNPIIMSDGLGPQVCSRYFCTTPVCVGELIGEEVNYSLGRNVLNFFCLEVQSPGAAPLVSSFATTCFTLLCLSLLLPTSLLPLTLSTMVNFLTKIFWLCCGFNGKQKVFTLFLTE